MDKTIICLANSRKLSARCIAGKELESKKWIRPVTRRASHEISRYQCQYNDGTYPQLLDIICIPFKEYAPHGHQPENVVIDDGRSWKKIGAVTYADLAPLVDDGPLPWANSSTFGKINDKIPEALLNPEQGSLRLIFVDSVTLKVQTKTLYASSIEKTVIRAAFQHEGTPYSLDVTDPVIENRYLRSGIGEFILTKVYLCISLGELYHGFSYKLVSAIIMGDHAP